MSDMALQFVIGSGPQAGRAHVAEESKRKIRSNAMRWSRHQQKQKKEEAKKFSGERFSLPLVKHRSDETNSKLSKSARAAPDNTPQIFTWQANVRVQGVKVQEAIEVTSLHDEQYSEIALEGRQEEAAAANDGTASWNDPDASVIVRHSNESVVRSPAANRIALFNAFTVTLTPSGSRMPPHVFCMMLHLSEMPNTTLTACCDALSLIQYGLVANREAAILEGRKRHLAAIMLLRKDMESAAARPCNNVAAAEMLMLCEIYCSVSGGASTWNTHVSGITALIRSWNYNLQQDQFDRMPLYWALLYFALLQGLFTRRPVDMNLLCKVPSHSRGSGDISRLLELASRLPSLMEKSDVIVSLEAVDRKKAIELVSQLLIPESESDRWLAAFYLAEYGCSRVYRKCWEDAPDPGTESQALRFRSQLHATYHTVYWICLLLLRECLYNVRNENGAGLQRDLFHDISDCADKLCQSVPYLSQAGEGTLVKAIAVRAPLHFAGRWFERVENNEKRAWCRTAEGRMQREFPFLQWDALLPWSFFMIPWLSNVPLDSPQGSPKTTSPEDLQASAAITAGGRHKCWIERRSGTGSHCIHR